MPERSIGKRFRDAKTFAVYYGYGKEEELSRYDIAIVEPGGHNAEGIGRLEASGTVALAYVSVLEVNSSTPGAQSLREEDFVFEDGRPKCNETYHTKIARLYSDRWLSVLLRRVERLLLCDGYDGIFLDTLADLECLDFSREEYHKMLNAALRLLAGLRSRFPQHLVVQNNGLGKLYSATSAYLDGICWENPPAADPAEIERLGKFLCDLSERGDLKILLLLNRDHDLWQRMAERYGFLSYFSHDGMYLQCDPFFL